MITGPGPCTDSASEPCRGMTTNTTHLVRPPSQAAGPSAAGAGSEPPRRSDTELRVLACPAVAAEPEAQARLMLRARLTLLLEFETRRRRHFNAAPPALDGADSE